MQISFESDVISGSNLTRHQNVMEKVATRAIDAKDRDRKLPQNQDCKNIQTGADLPMLQARR